MLKVITVVVEPGLHCSLPPESKLFKNMLFIYLVALGLSCGVWGLHCDTWGLSLWGATSPAVTHGLYSGGAWA